MSEKSKAKYKMMREKGICFDCRRPLDRDGIVCTSCKDKRNAYGKSYRQLYLDRGICPRCRVNKLYGDERLCLECEVKHVERINEARNKDRGKYNSYTRAYNKQKRAECVEKGICTRCRKRKVVSGRRRCSYCNAKEAKYKREKYYKEKQEGICIFCQNPVEKGYKVCPEHHQRAIEMATCENAKKARAKMKEQRIGVYADLDFIFAEQRV